MNTPNGHADLTVVNFSRNAPGPLAGLLLADLGADVVKVENPRTGDGIRDSPPLIHGLGGFHWALNGGSRSVAMDPASPEWQESVSALISWADIVITGGGEERTRRLGIDFESAARINPRTVYVSVTGYGETGPRRDLPAHGLNPDAFAGIVPIDWIDGVPSPRPGYHSASATLAGVFGALGAMAAVRRRDLTGERQYVHVSLFGSAMWWNWRNVVSLTGLDQEWWDYRDIGSRYATYGTADGRALLIAPIERKFWHAACRTLGLPEEWQDRGRWDAGGGYDRGSGYDDESTEIARVIATRSLAQWCEVLDRAGIPFAPILTATEAIERTLADSGQEVLRRVEMARGSTWAPAPPVRVGCSPASVAGPAAPVRAPELGADQDFLEVVRRRYVNHSTIEREDSGR